MYFILEEGPLKVSSASAASEEQEEKYLPDILNGYKIKYAYKAYYYYLYYYYYCYNNREKLCRRL